MRILGIDPGITRCGLGVVDIDTARRTTLVYVDVARTPTNLATHFRVGKIADAIDEVIDNYEPEIVAMERVFAQHNLQSVTTTMQIMGAAMVCTARHGLPLAIHTPSEVKAAVTGSGTANKAQVQNMVKRILRMDEIIKPADAADAVAIAICHGWRGDGIQGAGEDGTVSVSLSGKVSARARLTEAQQKWADAQAAQRRSGFLDPKRSKATGGRK
ncbi:MAG: crossover junction endodeoxyribonuclease RuvC [Varibaculum sp.]|nr:crossover junction endodeoxyribonuclease RuvC [Varibaculum sp.]